MPIVQKEIMIKPNLPEKPIHTAIVSCDIPKEAEFVLNSLDISILKLTGYMPCDKAVKNHPDMYFTHCAENAAFYLKNYCFLNGKSRSETFFYQSNLDSLQSLHDYLAYPDDVSFNCVFLDDLLICNKKYVNAQILNFAKSSGKRIINVRQGYAKCNICVVNENSIITEDAGIAKALKSTAVEVLLLEHKAVGLKGYKHGFIGGCSGKIAKDKLAFFGKIENHPEFNKIYEFLFKRNVEAVSLTNDCLCDFGSLIPIE